MTNLIDRHVTKQSQTGPKSISPRSMKNIAYVGQKIYINWTSESPPYDALKSAIRKRDAIVGLHQNTIRRSIIESRVVRKILTSDKFDNMTTTIPCQGVIISLLQSSGKPQGNPSDLQSL